MRRLVPSTVAPWSSWLMAGLVLSLAALPFLTTPAHADLKQARALLDAGQIEAAREAYEEVLSGGNDREALYQLALLSTSGHDYARYLMAFLDAGGRRDRRAPEVELRLGRFHYTSGDYRSALDLFESVRDRGGDAAQRVEARYWLGRTLLALREPNDARRALEAVIGEKGGSAWQSRANYSLGELLRVSGNPTDAAKVFGRLRGDANLGAAAMLAEAHCREAAGDHREAAALYADLLRLRPTSSEAAVAREWTRLREVATARGKNPTDRDAGGTSGESGNGTASPGTTTGGSTSTTSDTGTWRVQVGAFSSVANAEKLVRELEQRGYPEVMAERGDEAGALYHVRFGRYPDRRAADQAGLDVSAMLGLRYSLVAP